MQKTSSLLWSCLAGIAAVVCFGADVSAAGRSMVAGSSAGTARMPTMPTMSINTIGTHAIAGVAVDQPTPAPTPTPTPEPQPDPTPVCPDGSVVNSDFTVNDCMQSLLSCVQGGGLAHGLNDLFNSDLRNSIINGMGVCAADIDRCIREVRVDCNSVYNSSVDVWLDFNSRIVQPEYYNFVLRKTGLTPNQAENVCGLLDKNVYGKSFAAVSATGNVTGEYQKDINAYNNNSDGGKAYPVGSMENTTANGNVDGVDGERGHYARWDATNGVCKVRVAAYNKDKLITNSWFFGTVGNDNPAEVWQDAGSTFTCNKDLFDFSLLNTTKTVAATAIPGGALVGGITGYVLGQKGGEFDCGDDDMRAQLFEDIEDIKDNLQPFLSEVIPLSKADFTKSMCKEIQDLYKNYINLRDSVDSTCLDGKMAKPGTQDFKCPASISGTDVYINGSLSGQAYALSTKGCAELDKVIDALEHGTSVTTPVSGMQINLPGETVVVEGLTLAALEMKGGALQTLRECREVHNCGNAEKVDCTYKSLRNPKRQKLLASKEYVCVAGSYEECKPVSEINKELDDLKEIYAKLDILTGDGVESTKLKSTLIGTGIGLGAGGVATAITAFVERNNITCRVGDGLNSVGFGKSFTIDSLKDFYVKWNLRVADSISPTARVTSCQDWVNTCGMYTTPSDCNSVVINYQAPGRNTTNTVYSACRMSGSVCVENRPVAVSYGACENDGQSGNGSQQGTGTVQSISLITH